MKTLNDRVIDSAYELSKAAHRFEDDWKGLTKAKLAMMRDTFESPSEAYALAAKELAHQISAGHESATGRSRARVASELLNDLLDAGVIPESWTTTELDD